MDKYEMEKYSIAGVEDVRLKDENGEYWYPLSSFSRKMLDRTKQTAFYRDHPKFGQYMKVISYTHPNSVSKLPEKTWFMNTEGIYLLLQDTTVEAKRFSTKVLLQEKKLAEIKNYFGVSNIKDKPLFISSGPDISDYDVWSILCIRQDWTLKNSTIWRKCSECGYYYPFTSRYFVRGKCKQCAGYDFVCLNKRIQFLRKNMGDELLYQYFLGNKENIAEEFKKWISGGGI